MDLNAFEVNREILMDFLQAHVLLYIYVYIYIKPTYKYISISLGFNLA